MSTPALTSPAVQTCPECGARLDVDPRFSAWCPHCDWNLVPAAEAAEPPAHGADRAEQLYEDLAAGRSATGRRDWLAASAFAALVHLSTTALLAWALWLLVTGNTPLRCLGAAALAVVVLLRPRLGRVPRGESVLDRHRAPALYGLTDRIAARVGAGPVGVVRVDESFNASIAVVGLRRRSVLTLGLPLWEALTEQQRIALLGHELAHRVNGDHRRGLWLGSAISALAHWHDLARPRQRTGDTAAIPVLLHLAELVADALLNSLAWLLLKAVRQLDRLTARAGQQAEYHADKLSARAASTTATRGLLETVLLDGATHTLVTRLRADLVHRPRTVRRGAARPPQEPVTTTLWEQLREHLATIPPLERERLLRRSAIRQDAVDATHPPTHLRLALLGRRPSYPAVITTTPAESAAIAAELAPHRERVARALLAG
ncbi:M48 family metalloprotease [Kitasatospora sp. NPDC052868]|uniref:M48 family metallopeptidase n=1 Tax=Kitasatospora sp. NPDC052868 TaxID=3364060 RepID=UPI0037CA87D8